MEKYFFMKPLLALLARGSFFKKLVSLTLRISAAVVILGSLATFFKAGKVVFELPASGIMGGILFQLFFIVAIYAVVHILLIRARDIDNLSDEKIIALPIGAILLKMVGEIYASFVGLLAVGGGVFVWFTGRKIEAILKPVPSFFPPMGSDPNFMGGIEFMLGGILISLGVLIGAYILAEILSSLPRTAVAPITATPSESNGGQKKLHENGIRMPYRV